MKINSLCCVGSALFVLNVAVLRLRQKTLAALTKLPIFILDPQPVCRFQVLDIN